MNGGYRYVKKMIEKTSRMDFTSLSAYSQFVAIGIMKALREEGFKIPEDIAVAGFDDIEITSILEIPLTPLHISHHRLEKKQQRFLLTN